MQKHTLFALVLLLSCLVVGRADAYVRSPVDLSHLRNADYSAYFAAYPRLAPYPVSYDLRDVDGNNYVTPVRDQALYGTSWAHAAMASMESIYLRRTGIALDLSEMYLAYYTYMDPVGFSPGTPDFPALLDNGGSFLTTAAALAGWRGAVLETDLPYSDAAAPAGTASDYPNRLRLRHAYYLGEEAEDAPEPQPTDDIRKEMIMTHGAIAVMFDAHDQNINEDTAAWYNDTDLSPEDDEDPTDLYHPDHAAAIIGWDDTYSRENFNEAMRPSQDGAWLIKNSWGEEHGIDGYCWVSYEDESLEEGIAFIAGDASEYDNLYDYDTLGWCDTIGDVNGGNTTAWMANVFTARGTEELRAVSFYTLDNNASYEISVHTSPESENPASGTRASFQTGSQPIAGYHTVDLETPVFLAPETAFSVVVRVTNTSYDEPIAVELPIEGYSDAASANPGESFFSLDGLEWDDVSDGPEDEQANVCVKAFTVDISADVSAPAPSDGGEDDGGSDSRSGGGCSAGFSVLALALLSFAAGKRK